MRLLPIDAGACAAGPIRLGFGCASLGDVPGLAAKCRVIEAAYDAGFRHFDVAPSYGHGEAELALASALRGVRERVSIVSKAGIAHPRGGGVLQRLRRAAAPLKKVMPSLWGAASRRTSRLIAPAGRFEPAQIEASVSESLRRLQSDFLDGLLLHEVAVADLGPALVAVLDRFAAQGLVRGLGTGTGVEETVRIAAAQVARFAAFQVNHYWGSRTPALLAPDVALITHRCMRTGLVVRNEPAFRHAVDAHPLAAELRAVCADDQRAADVFLLAAICQPGPAMVLVSSSRPERARRFVQLAQRDDLFALASAMNQCLDRAAASNALAPPPGSPAAAPAGAPGTLVS